MEKVKDPVCGMEIDKEKNKGTTIHMGKTYYFCGGSSQEEFEKGPEKFANGKKGSSKA